MPMTFLTSWFFEHSEWSTCFGWYLFLCFLLIDYLPSHLSFKILCVCGFLMSFTVRNALTDTQPLSKNQQNSVSRCHAFLLTENPPRDVISNSYLWESFLELIIKNCMHILWRFSSLFHFVTPSWNRLNCFRNKVNMKEIL